MIEGEFLRAVGVVSDTLRDTIDLNESILYGLLYLFAFMFLL